MGFVIATVATLSATLCAEPGAEKKKLKRQNALVVGKALEMEEGADNFDIPLAKEEDEENKPDAKKPKKKGHKFREDEDEENKPDAKKPKKKGHKLREEEDEDEENKPDAKKPKKKGH